LLLPSSLSRYNASGVGWELTKSIALRSLSDPMIGNTGPKISSFITLASAGGLMTSKCPFLSAVGQLPGSRRQLACD
jgi:hypothetical protein